MLEESPCLHRPEMAIGFVAKANNLRQFLTDGVEVTLNGYIRHKVPKRRVTLEMK